MEKDEIKKEFDKLHIELVNKVISFCKKHNIKADEFHLSADCLEPSIEKGEWCPYTDSAFTLLERDKETYILKEILWSA